MGDYSEYEYIWHEGEYESGIRRLTDIEFIEFLAELVDENLLSLVYANQILKRANSTVQLKMDTSAHPKVSAELLLDTSDFVEDAHPNILQLVQRMDHSLAKEDYSAVLHSAASALETLAKMRLKHSNPATGDKSLGSFFDAYRSSSTLPTPVLNWIREIYQRRNREPLAGHGQTDLPQITKEETSLISEMTKAFIRHEQFIMPLDSIPTSL